jgi:hypothetical protein
MRLLLRLRSRGELAARPPGAAVYRLKDKNQGDNDYAVVSQVMAELSRESAIREQRVVHKHGYPIAIPTPQHKSRAQNPGFCGVFLSGFVFSARRRPDAYLSRQLRASSRQSQPDASIPRQDACKNNSAACKFLRLVRAYTG